MDAPPYAGRNVILEPLTEAHAKGLAELIRPDDDAWTWMPTWPRTPDEYLAWIRARLTPPPGLENHAYAQIDPLTRRLMGSTSLFEIDAKAHSAEIGHTWLAAPYRRSGANTEAKLFLLTHGFETLGLRRIQLMTNANNVRSQRAIERIGATREGLLRNFRRNRDGTLRDTVLYSVIDTEWPSVKARLSALVR